MKKMWPSDGVQGPLYKAASAVLLPVLSSSMENLHFQHKSNPIPGKVQSFRNPILLLKPTHSVGVDCDDEKMKDHRSSNSFGRLKRSTSLSLQNFFSKRSFKSNPLKRTKSVTKLERKRVNVHDVNP